MNHGLSLPRTLNLLRGACLLIRICFKIIPLFTFCLLTEAEVSKLLLSSHPTTCPLDPIPSHLLQAISPTLLPALTHIINTSLLTGIFPTVFKQAQVTPLLKKTTLNHLLTDSYRPDSSLSFIAKTLEQSGFRRRGHSIETALLSVTEALLIAKADSKSSVLILLDLSAAFDTVSHQILLSTLSSLDITGIPLRWFESYLTGQSFRVAWGAEVSAEYQLATGVPQGSVIGPLLFSTYTTSLAPIIQAYGFSYHCYADDAQLYLSFQPDDPTVAARISGCLANISTWMKEHHLQLNLAKTELLVFPATLTQQHDFTIQLGSSTITPSNSVRNLGVIFDDQLTFKNHIAKTARSCRFALLNIRNIRPFLTQQAVQLIVQPMSRLSLCPCTGYRLQLASSSRHWCLHIEQPQAQHPPTSTHYYESTSPPEAPPTSTHYYESTSPPEAPPTSTHYYESTSPPEAPPTSTHYYESTSPPEAPPTSTHYYESISPPEAPPTSTHYYESTSPPEAPPTSTHYYESTSPQEAWDLRASVVSWCHHSPERFHSPFLAGGKNFPPPSWMLNPWQFSSDTWKFISSVITWFHL